MLKKWPKIEESSAWDGYRKLIRRVFKMPDGTTSEFEIKKEGAVVCVLPLTKDNNVILIKQFRPGPEKILLELPGGCVDKGEKPAEAVQREMLEETGFTGDFKSVNASFQCAYSTRIKYNFVATNCRKIGEQQLSENEFGEVAEMTLDDFKKHLRSGQLTDVDTGYLGLDYLKLL